VPAYPGCPEKQTIKWVFVLFAWFTDLQLWLLLSLYNMPLLLQTGWKQLQLTSLQTVLSFPLKTSFIRSLAESVLSTGYWLFVHSF